jgi:beta-lactamase class A
MKKLVFSVICTLAYSLLALSATAQKKPEFSIPKDYQPLKIEKSTGLQSLLDSVISETLAEFSEKKLKAENIAVTLIDLREAKNAKMASFRGQERIYPASVVKMFYMVALERWLEDGKVKSTPELERGLRDMIVDSSNEATQYIMDVLTGVSSGGELPVNEFRKWAYKRNIVNRYFAAMGYENINVNQKTHCEDAYGIEQQFRNYRGENRNMLTTDATARLLAEIVLGKTNTPERTQKMMNLLKRDPFAPTNDIDDQAHGFTGIALINKDLREAKLWSKAGWTSKARHDAAYIETPDGLKLVLVIFTENFAKDRNIIPTIAEKIIERISKI